MSGKTAATVKTKPRGLARVTGGRQPLSAPSACLAACSPTRRKWAMSRKTPLTAFASPPTSADHSGLRQRSIAPSGRLWRPLRVKGEHWQAIAAIRLIALTGCRRSEILNLKWSEVDFKGSCLRLGDTKTGASIRPVTRARPRDPGASQARRRLCLPGRQPR